MILYGTVQNRTVLYSTVLYCFVLCKINLRWLCGENYLPLVTDRFAEQYCIGKTSSKINWQFKMCNTDDFFSVAASVVTSYTLCKQSLNF